MWDIILATITGSRGYNNGFGNFGIPGIYIIGNHGVGQRGIFVILHDLGTLGVLGTPGILGFIIIGL